MEDLRQLFLSLGFNNVKSYINSGNIIFETSEIDSNAIIKGIHRELNELLEGETRLVVSATTRSWTTVKRIAKDATTNSTIHFTK
jgi:uncharacterized protein (DUF1697 family)